ncbi:MAG: tail-specific protease [Planctomycetes bacterium]|nr:tail-specific protease [Planctomycetota bacterium]
MTRRFVSSAALLGLLLLPLWLSAQPIPGKNDRLLTQIVCEFFQRGHVTRPKIGDEVSMRLFKRFLKDLDPGKLYFQKSDIDEFKKSETELDDMLLKGDLSFAYKVYERFVERIDERLKLVDEFLGMKHDFGVKEYMDTDSAKLEYPADAKEASERCRKRIKLDLLLQRLGTKPVPDDEARKKVRDRYRNFAKRVRQLDNYDLMEMYLSAFAASLDPHSSYLSPTTLEDFTISMRLQLEGIGAVLREEGGNTIVVEVVPGGAAAKDGRLKANDKIIGVAQSDGKFVDVVDMKLRDVVKQIRGAKGTKVELKVVPAGKIEPTIYALTRQKIEIKSQAARYDIVEDGKKPDGTPYRIGVIDLPSFYANPAKDVSEVKSASKDIRRILKEMSTKKVDGVILDMRRNPGGFLAEAVALAGLFIDKGPIVQVKDPQQSIQRHDDPEAGMVYDGPLMVLTSRSSASASEIVAAALQDYGRAIVVGDPATHGKGTVQAVIDLGEQVPNSPKLGALRLTLQQFYRVNGDSTQNRGVASDIVLPSLTEHLSTPEKDMENALAFDQVKPATFKSANMISAELKANLKARSAARVQASKEFAKLARDIDRVKMLRDRKKMPLSEQELKEQMGKEDDPDQPKKDDDGEKGVYKFRRNFFNNEILKIMEDLLQNKSPAAPQGQGRLHRRLESSTAILGRSALAAP